MDWKREIERENDYGKIIYVMYLLLSMLKYVLCLHCEVYYCLNDFLSLELEMLWLSNRDQRLERNGYLT